MPTWNADNAECHVFAFKEGLLSAAGHDVKLRVGRFELVTDEHGAMRGTFDASSLEVVCAMHQGQERPDALSESDRKTIEGYVTNDILEVEEHPDIAWTTTKVRRDGDQALRVEGQLTLHGRKKPVRAKVVAEDDRWVARARIRQPEFGIKPFSALLGALKIKAVVEVELAVPKEGYAIGSAEGS